MRIGMVLDNTFPPDSRVENEAVSLIAAGHEVFLFCLKRGNEATQEEINGIRICRYATSNFEYKLSALAYTLPLYHYFMAKKLRQFVKDAQPEVLHLHDLTIARAGFTIAKKAGIPIVLDLHENRPVIMKEYVHLKKWPGKWLISPSVWDRFQGEYARAANRLIVVTDEAAADLSKSYTIPRDKITVVPNTVSSDLYLKYPLKHAISQKFASGFNILYMGDTGLRRGTDTAIKAMALLAEDIPEARLILVGSNTEDIRLRELARQEQVEDRGVFEAWPDVSLFPSYVAAAALCIPQQDISVYGRRKTTGGK